MASRCRVVTKSMKNTTKLFNEFSINSKALNIQSDVQLSKTLNSILIGIMLGDGGIYRTSVTSNSRFEMSFGGDYKQFAESIGLLFKDYMSNPVKEIKLKGKTKVYTNFRLKTVSLPVFNQYHDMFYKWSDDKGKYIKVVPVNILELMDSVVFAYLIMTDGNFDTNRNRVRIYTNSFTKEEVISLGEAINKKFGIYVGILHDRRDQWILTIGAKQLDLLRQIVSIHFAPSMLYRIGSSRF